MGPGRGVWGHQLFFYKFYTGLYIIFTDSSMVRTIFALVKDMGLFYHYKQESKSSGANLPHLVQTIHLFVCLILKKSFIGTLTHVLLLR